MKKRLDLRTYLVIIFLLGLVASVLNSAIPFGALFKGWGVSGLETVLDTLSIGLAFVALGFLVFFLVSRSARGGKEKKDKRRLEEPWDDEK